MMFRDYVSEILHTEISNVIEKQGYLIELEFCNAVRDKYSLSIPTIRAALHGIYPELSLTKKRLSNELKSFYHIEIKGCPIIYFKNK